MVNSYYFSKVVAESKTHARQTTINIDKFPPGNNMHYAKT